MKVAVIQIATLLGENKKNRIRLEPFMQQAVAEKVDVIVLPETWNVGFIPENITECAEDAQRSESLQWMINWAATHHVHIVGGSIAVKEENRLYNRCYIIDRQGNVVHTYDKIHLFSPGKESEYFSPGNQIGSFELDGITCAVQICYDLRFPELTRRQALMDVHVLFVPAQWPHPRSLHWMRLNQARAIENQLFVIAANGCGSVGPVQSCGHSLIYSPWGDEHLLVAEEEGVYIRTLDLFSVEQARTKIPVFNDRRVDVY